MLKNPEYSREAISISPLWGFEFHPMEEKVSKISKKGNCVVVILSVKPNLAMMDGKQNIQGASNANTIKPFSGVK